MSSFFSLYFLHDLTQPTEELICIRHDDVCAPIFMWHVGKLCVHLLLLKPTPITDQHLLVNEYSKHTHTLPGRKWHYHGWLTAQKQDMRNMDDTFTCILSVLATVYVCVCGLCMCVRAKLSNKLATRHEPCSVFMSSDSWSVQGSLHNGPELNTCNNITHIDMQ